MQTRAIFDTTQFTIAITSLSTVARSSVYDQLLFGHGRACHVPSDGPAHGEGGIGSNVSLSEGDCSRIGEWEHGILDAHALTMRQSWTARSLGDIVTESSADLVAPGPAHAS